jgi:8-oxo-dGTP pyrophosphatase MutT (NUDIX family)
MPKVTKVPAPVRQQSGVLPYKRSKQIKVCLVKQSNGKYWGIPKGGVENGLTDKVSAMKEALEEAGLQGRIVGKNIGLLPHRRRNLGYFWHRNTTSRYWRTNDLCICPTTKQTSSESSTTEKLRE